MGKFKLPVWLQSPATNSTTTSEAQRKKQNRRSLSTVMSSTSKHAKGPMLADSQNGHETLSQASQGTVSEQPSRMVVLASTIQEETAKLDEYMRANGIESPDFSSNSASDFPQLPDEMHTSRMNIIFATKELSALAHGPRESLRWGAWRFLDVLSLQIINHYQIAKLVPVDGLISFKKLQEKTTLDGTNLARIVRHAMTDYIFHEPSPGFIAHTAASRVLAEDSSLQDWIGFNSEDIFPSAANVLPALKTYPEATSLTRSGFTFAFNTVDKESMFATIGKDSIRAKRFAGAMSSLTGGEGYEVHHFVDNIDLADVNDAAGTFVDIGGSHGFVSVALAREWPRVKFIVQDLQKTVESAPNPISTDENIAERVQLQVHDFFTTQPVKYADVYYFRWIIHNYSTPYAIKLLKNLVPALKPGARIIINDICLRPAGTENAWDDQVTRSMDLIMLILLNSQERDEAEFRELFYQADPRYEFKGSTRTKGCRMSVVEAVWNPDKSE